MPRAKLAPGEQVTVEVVVRRPRLLRWALGSSRTERLTLTAPVAQLTQRWPSLAPKAALRLRYADPVDRVSYRIGSRRKLVPAGGRLVSLGAQTASGTAEVAAAPRAWERLGKPVRVTWFPKATVPVVLVSPATGDPISPLDPVRLTFSQPVSRAIGDARPTFSPAVSGTWRETDSHTLVFVPRGFGFPFDSDLHLRLPSGLSVSVGGAAATSTQAVAWKVAGRELPAPAAAARRAGLPAGRLAADGRPGRAAAGRPQVERGRRSAGRDVHRGATRTRRPSCRASGRPGSRTRSRAAR